MTTFVTTWLHQWHVTPDSPKRKQSSSNKVWIPMLHEEYNSNSSIPAHLLIPRHALSYPLFQAPAPTPNSPTFQVSSKFAFKAISINNRLTTELFPPNFVLVFLF